MFPITWCSLIVRHDSNLGRLEGEWRDSDCRQLHELLDDEEAEIVRCALGFSPKVDAAFLKLIDHEEPEVVGVAAIAVINVVNNLDERVLTEATPTPILREAIRRFIGLLDHAEAEIVQYACELVASVGTTAAIPKLIELLAEPEVLKSACRALAELKATEAIPTLIKLLNREDEKTEIFECARDTLAELKAIELGPTLIGLLNPEHASWLSGCSLDFEVRLLASSAVAAFPKILSTVGTSSSEVIGRIVRWCREEELNPRQRVLIGFIAEQYQPDLGKYIVAAVRPDDDNRPLPIDRLLAVDITQSLLKNAKQRWYSHNPRIATDRDNFNHAVESNFAAEVLIDALFGVKPERVADELFKKIRDRMRNLADKEMKKEYCPARGQTSIGGVKNRNVLGRVRH